SSAFSGCTSLTTVNLSGATNLTTIESSAFSGCTGLASVTLPESITTLGSSAFKGTALTSINIPQSLTSIGDDAFLDCTSLNTVNVNSADQFKAISFGGSAFNNVYNLYNNGSIIELDLSIAEGTTSINDTYSYCGSLKRLTIPSSVKTIAASAFYECTNLTEINYNATAVTSSNSNIFYNAGKNGSGITVNIASSVTSIPNYLFYTNGTSGNWPKVKALNIANDSALTSIGTRAFYGFAEITHITIPEKVTSIGSSAFANANALTEINYNAKALTTSLSQSSDIFYNAGRIASGITVNIGASVTSIPAYLFYVNTSHYCPNIKTVNFSENVTSIGNWAFRDLTGITSITIPEKVTSIGDYAFAGCASLTEITLPFVGNGSDKTSFGSIFGTVPTSLKTVTIIGGIIANDAFRDCSNIQSITLSDGVTGIGNYAFDGCTALTSITIPNSITSIGNYAFMDCSSLTSITIPSSVTSIGDNAFYYCTALTSVTIPDSVTSIGDRAFEFCARLTSIIIPNSVTSIGVAAFGSCEALTSITIPNSITRIERLTFCNCKALTSITIPNSITSIGTSAFEGCLALTSLELPDSLTYIGVYAFGSVPEGLMTTVDEIKYICSVTGKKLILIDATSFTGNSFSVPEECLAIYDQAFKGCTSLSSIIIAEGVTSIGSNAFCGCTALTSITIPNSVTS
ncbi:MAG: leucine-rich repeat domain-containing protein, partial [Clostridia bacterium]|nr:leucine-rich repeat domain-containing protein [Clostridia bacterium]